MWHYEALNWKIVHHTDWKLLFFVLFKVHLKNLKQNLNLFFVEMTLPEQFNKTEKVQVLLEGDTQTYNLAYNKKSFKIFWIGKKTDFNIVLNY